MFVVQTIFEAFLIGLVIVCFVNEEKLAKFEKQLVQKIRNKKER